MIASVSWDETSAKQCTIESSIMSSDTTYRNWEVI